MNTDLELSKSNLREYAEQGADYISIGYITNSSKAVDFSLELN